MDFLGYRLHRLLGHLDTFDTLFDDSVEQLRELLPDFEQRLAVDSKALPSFATHRPRRQEADGRRDTDADYGIKSYRATHPHGRARETIKRWFGYKIHLLVDPTYELPIGP